MGGVSGLGIGCRVVELVTCELNRRNRGFDKDMLTHVKCMWICEWLVK